MQWWRWFVECLRRFQIKFNIIATWSSSNNSFEPPWTSLSDDANDTNNCRKFKQLTICLLWHDFLNVFRSWTCDTAQHNTASLSAVKARNYTKSFDKKRESKRERRQKRANETFQWTRCFQPHPLRPAVGCRMCLRLACRLTMPPTLQACFTFCHVVVFIPHCCSLLSPLFQCAEEEDEEEEGWEMASGKCAALKHNI